MVTVREFIQKTKRENKNVYRVSVAYPTGDPVPLNKIMKNYYKVHYFIYTDNRPDSYSDVDDEPVSDEETEDFSTELEDYFL